MKSKLFLFISCFSLLAFAELPPDWNKPPISWTGAKLTLACESVRLISGPTTAMTPFDLAIVTSNDPRWYTGLFILKGSPAPYHPARYLSGYLELHQFGEVITYSDKDNASFFLLETDPSKKSVAGKVSATLKSGKWQVELLCSPQE